MIGKLTTNRPGETGVETMRIQGATALVSGANRGLGQVMARILLQRGAQRVYGGARDPGSVVEPGVTPVRLDISDPVQWPRQPRRAPT
ncbi:hypothetical protein ACGFZQ_45195 [Streptomyces sp. NPDC048254]|uniref:hypothetical protein n=1 Tax=Streptomyces sp. NPDC048254 TaxID=3365525 RepID=UPI00370F7F7B